MQSSREINANKAKDTYCRLATQLKWPKNTESYLNSYFPIPLPLFLKYIELLVSKVNSREVQLADVLRMMEYVFFLLTFRDLAFYHASINHADWNHVKNHHEVRKLLDTVHPELTSQVFSSYAYKPAAIPASPPKSSPRPQGASQPLAHNARLGAHLHAPSTTPLVMAPEKSIDPHSRIMPQSPPRNNKKPAAQKHSTRESTILAFANLSLKEGWSKTAAEAYPISLGMSSLLLFIQLSFINTSTYFSRELRRVPSP
jgi:hypothetical protein